MSTPWNRRRMALLVSPVLVLALAAAISAIIVEFPRQLPREYSWAGWPGAPAAGHVTLAKDRFLSVLNGPAGAFFGPGGRQVVTIDSTGQLLTWNLATGASTSLVPPGTPPYDTLYGVAAVSQDGTMLAAWDDNRGHLDLWNLVTGTFTGSLSVPDGARATAIGFSADDTVLAAGTGSGITYLWRRAPRARGFQAPPASLLPRAPVPDPISAFAFSPDGKALVAGDVIGNVYVWDLASRSLRARLSDHPAPGRGPSYVLGQEPVGVTSLSAGENGALVAVGDGDGRIYLWDLGGRRVIARPGRSLAPYYSLVSAAFSPDGGTLAARLSDDTVVVWSVATGRTLAVVSGTPGQPNWLSGDPVDEVAFSPDGRLLATSDGNGVTIWQVAS